MAVSAVTAIRQVSFSARLRAATRSEHEEVEQVVELPGRLTSTRDLERLLRTWRLVWTEARDGCGPAGHDESARLLVAAVRAVQQLTVDLGDLTAVHGDLTAVHGDDGPEPPEDPAPADPAGLAQVLRTEPGLWATSYVLRGSRIGGTVLAPLIAERLRLPESLAAAYHGDPTAGRTWAAFRGRLDTWGDAATAPARDEAVRRAAEVFHLLGARLSRAVRGARSGEDFG